jgi:hypothetical protein
LVGNLAQQWDASSEGKHALPAPKGTGKGALVACYDETGFSRLRLLARTEGDEVAVAFEDAIDLGRVSLAVNFALPRCGYSKRCWQAILERRRIDRHAVLLEGLGKEDLRRIRLTIPPTLFALADEVIEWSFRSASIDVGEVTLRVRSDRFGCADLMSLITPITTKSVTCREWRIGS